LALMRLDLLAATGESMTPEQKARVSIDALLKQAGWHVCNRVDANIHAADGEVKSVRYVQGLPATLAAMSISPFSPLPRRRRLNGNRVGASQV